MPVAFSSIGRWISPRRVAHAHCDLPCGVYDPAQARIEAESVRNCQQKYQESDDPVFRERAILIKEQRADLDEKFWQATKLAGDAKNSQDPAQGQELLDAIEEISNIFWKTKEDA